MIGGREKRHVAPFLDRLFLDLRPVRPAPIHVQMKWPFHSLAVVHLQLDQSVISLSPKALSQKIRASSARLHGVKRRRGRAGWNEHDSGLVMRRIVCVIREVGGLDVSVSMVARSYSFATSKLTASSRYEQLL